jgi:hypothetical protein
VRVAGATARSSLPIAGPFVGTCTVFVFSVFATACGVVFIVQSPLIGD